MTDSHEPRPILPTRGRPRWRVVIAALGLAVVVTVQLVQSATNPRWNWDLVGYVACAFELTTPDVEAVQHRTFAAIEHELPAAVAAELRAGDDYRVAVSSDVESFSQQLPFYRIRPIYTGLLSGAIALGIAPVRATQVVSLAAAILTVIVILLALRRFLPLDLACLATAAILLVAPVFDTARSSSPDSLAALFAILGTALVTARSRRWQLAGAVVLVATIAVRTDQLLFVAAVLAAVGLGRERRREALIAGGAAVILLVTLQSAAGWYGWQALFVHTFDRPLAYPADASPDVSLASYWQQVAAGFHSKGRDRALAFIASALTLAGLLRNRIPRRAFWLATLIAIAWIAHFLAFPVWWKRFFVAHVAVIGALGLLGLLRSSPDHALAPNPHEPATRKA